MRAMEIALDVKEAFNEEKGGSSGYKNTASFGRSRITGCTELYRGNSGPMSSSVASNTRKETSSSSRGSAKGRLKEQGVQDTPLPGVWETKGRRKMLPLWRGVQSRASLSKKNLRVIIYVEDEGGPTEENHGLLGQIEENLDDEEEREYRQMDLSIFSAGV